MNNKGYTEEQQRHINNLHYRLNAKIKSGKYNITGEEQFIKEEREERKSKFKVIKK